MPLEKHNIVCSIFLSTLIAWQFIYYVSGTTKSSWGLKHKDTVKTIVGDHDVINCVNMDNQHATIYHPIGDNNKDLKMEPSSYPIEIKMELASNGEISQDWHKYEKCPEGTVPIRRSTSSITRKHPSLLRRHFNSSLVQSPKGIHEYALVRSKDNQYYGATATLSVWKPKVEVNELSLAQLWISSGYGVNLNTIEVGWMVYPKKYGDDLPRFFIYWTRDYYTTTGCYDIDCPGFVQTNFNIQLGHPFPISTVGGPTCAIRIMVYKDGKNGNWWLDYNGVDIGYFPKNLFTSLSEYAQRVDFGGEIVNKENEGHHTTTQMGNGLYPHETGASFITGIKLYGRDRKPVKGDILQPIVSVVPCYRLNLINDTIFYGGPGYSELCR